MLVNRSVLAIVLFLAGGSGFAKSIPAAHFSQKPQQSNPETVEDRTDPFSGELGLWSERTLGGQKQELLTPPGTSQHHNGEKNRDNDDSQRPTFSINERQHDELEGVAALYARAGGRAKRKHYRKTT